MLWDSNNTFSDVGRQQLKDVVEAEGLQADDADLICNATPLQLRPSV